MNTHEQRQFYYLITQSLEGTITSEQFLKLKQTLRSSPEAVQYYVDYLSILSDIHSSNGLLNKDVLTAETMSHPGYDTHFWEAMAEEEKVAPKIEIHDEPPQRELIQKVVYPPRQSRKISKFVVFTLINAAAMLLLFVSLQMLPPKGDVKVATLVDSLDAKWADVGDEMVNGTSIVASGKSLLLRQGFAEFLFDNQTKVTFEGPAEFQILTEDQVKLNYGRLYARVPREAIGFTVKTPSAQIVDLGTEFGVDCDFHSDTSLHVMKGKTILIAGNKSNKVSLGVNAGIAKKVSSVTQTVSDISCNDRLFVREINSAAHILWRGESQISVADVITGGNGFETVQSLVGLDPVTGRYTSSIDRGVRSPETIFSLVPRSPFVDGVFVADGGQDGRVVITSEGDMVQCPDTEGLVSHEITVYTGDITKQQDTIPPAIFDGHRYENNAIVMIHSNAGITLDLKAIRQSLPGLNVSHFKAFGGLSEALKEVKRQLPDVGFWVVVDGQVRYEKKALNLKDYAVSFDIELKPQDRYLTLIVTDGSRPKDTSRQYAAWNNDFFYLVDPILEITGNTD